MFKSIIALLLAAIFFSGCVQDQSSFSFPEGRWIDLSYEYSDKTIYWPTAEGFELTNVAAGMTERGYYYSANTFSTAEHGGTHLDSPIHFSEGQNSVEEIPLDRLIGPAVLIDVSEQALQDRDFKISVEDITTWESTNGEIPENVILFFRTGYGQYWPDADAYMGTNKQGTDAVAELHFPGIGPITAQWLVDNRTVKAIGIDTPSIDYGQSKLFESHQILYEENIPGLENVANLDELPVTGSLVVALPMKIKGGSGAPLRIAALLP